MRTRIAALVIGAAVLVSGCTRAAATDPAPAPAAPRPKPPPPAADAGGACKLLDFAVIARTLGVRFNVAAAHRSGKTLTCVVQAMGAGRPDLVLSVSPTAVDAAVFAAAAAPDRSAKVTGLGKAAYRASLPPGRGYGAGVEIGWLTADKRLITLRYTLAKRGSAAAARKFGPRLTELAREIDVAGRVKRP